MLPRGITFIRKPCNPESLVWLSRERKTMPGLIAPIAERAQQREKQVDVDEVEIEGDAPMTLRPRSCPQLRHFPNALIFKRIQGSSLPCSNPGSAAYCT
jgi:hypothetical protein